MSVVAATISSVTGPAPNPFAVVGVNSTRGYGISWSETGSYQAVAISLELRTFGIATGNAYLTTKVGSGTTASDEVASTSFNFPANPTSVVLFTGLTLAAGTYYLTISGVSGTGGWDGTDSPTPTTAPGVTQNSNYAVGDSSSPLPSYPPSGQISSAGVLKYAVVGTSAPEPQSTLLLLLGLFCACISRIRRQSA